MRRYILCLILILPVLLCGEIFQLLQENQDLLDIKFTLPQYSIEDAIANGNNWQKIVCDDGTVSGNEAHPELMVFSTAVAVPVDGDYSISVESSDSKKLSGIYLQPMLTMKLSGEETVYSRTMDFKAYNNSDLLPTQLAEKGTEAFIGNRKFIPLRINPFQYNAKTRELLVHELISIRVIIHGTKSATRNWQTKSNPLDSSSSSFFLNDSSSKSWRRERQKSTSYQSPKSGTNGVNEIQIIVDEEGIYKVSYQYLMNLITVMADSLQIVMDWTPASVDPRYLELSDEYGQTPINFIGENDGRFDPSDYFEFFGDRHYGETSYMDDFTAENVYSLKLIDRFGARMVVENGGLVVSDVPVSSIPDAYEETFHFEQQLVSDKLGNGWAQNNDFYREDIWFWKRITAPNLDIIPVELQYPKDSTLLKASAKVALMGLTYYSGHLGVNQYDHEASVRLNQAMINTHSWRNQSEQIFTNQTEIPNTALRHGTNNFYISLSGNTVMGDKEQVMLDYAEITYWREYKTDQDFMKFTKPRLATRNLMQFQLEGFSNQNVSVYKIGSSVFNNLQIEPFNLEGIAPWTVTLQDSVASTAVRYYAVTEELKKTPKSARLNIPNDIKNAGNFADVVMITAREFVDAEGSLQLVDNWQANGYSAKIIDVQDIYDEFNAGIVSGESIKEFISYAYNNWDEPQLSHVVLLGEGVEDTRDGSPSRIYNIIPAKKVWTSEVGAIASDNWYACIVGSDPLPDVAISRICVWKKQQILDYAAKATSYYNNPQTSKLWNSHATLTAGGKIIDIDDIFAQQSEIIRRKSIPADYRVTKVYTNTQTVSTDYFGGSAQLKQAFNSGTKYLQFMGHGGGRIWADYNLFGFNDVASLNNTVYPIVVSLSCYGSAFDTNGMASISEAFVLQPGRGAIGTAGFSGLGYKVQDLDWGLAYTDALFKQDFSSVGKAWLFMLAKFYTVASSKLTQYAMTNGAVYMGDPLIYMRKPITGIPVNAANNVLDPGETLHVTATFPQDVSFARLYVTKENEIAVNIPYDRPVDNGNFAAEWTNADTLATNYTHKIYVAGYSATHEYTGRSVFSVGKPSVMHISITPAEPTWRDSVSFSAKVFSAVQVSNLTCRVRVDGSWVSIPMQKSDSDSTIYVSSSKYPPKKTAKEVFFKYDLITSDGNAESYLDQYVVRGPELVLKDIKLEQDGQNLQIKVLGANVGDANSITTDLRLFWGLPGASYNALTYFSKQDYLPLTVGQERWETIPINGLANANLKFQARVDSSNVNQEWNSYDNADADSTFIYNETNYIDLEVPLNYFSVDNTGATISSIDGNLSCIIPTGLVSTGHSFFTVAASPPMEYLNQPDVKPLMLRSLESISANQYSVPYEVSTLNSGLIDVNGTFVNEKSVTLLFFYNPTDAATQSLEDGNSYKIYRYNAEFKKWVLQGGHIDTSANTVTLEVDRPGVYTLFRNADNTVPTIDVNVQDQEFTVGGYIAGNGVISLLLSDANGINVIDDAIRLFMNGVQVPQEDYVISVNLENINRIPIKYQLSLGKGNHELKVDCRDLNGMYNTRDIQFVVNDEFDIVNVANYPNPVLGRAVEPKNDGRTRFTYVLTDGADEVTIKLFTVSGRLVKTFNNLPVGVGYHEYPRTLYGWDCKDDQGYSLANGVYFYRIIAKQGNKTIEKTQKMAILK
ncbi:MAG: C25 family cysteine peptidase [Candidatus Cloacimonetes bacterium]|nr:C25 family cysteine peptidase [Candidatus Cloacimonadota bacterium]